MAVTTATRLTRLRTLGRGASGAVVSLAADEASGRLLAVKSAAPAGAAQLRREQSVLSKLSSAHVIPCLGFRASGEGYELFLEFAPGGSLADVAARSGGRLEEGVMRAYAADVLRGLAYLHGNSLVHGDVKGRNVLVGADGRAKLADFGCARGADSARPIGGTPAFMAPEVARGEEQGPAADVWALGCTVVEMATGRAPWSDMDDVVAAVHRIGYTAAVPETPQWLSPEAKDFLGKCFRRDPRDRCTAAQLLEHPFVALAGCAAKPEPVKQEWVSPKSTLDAALWEPESDDEADEKSESPAERIAALAGPCSALPDWDSDDGWIEVVGVQCEVLDASPEPAEEMAGEASSVWGEELDTEVELFTVHVDGGNPVARIGVVDASIQQERNSFANLIRSEKISSPFACDGNGTVKLFDSTCTVKEIINFGFDHMSPLFDDVSASYLLIVCVFDYASNKHVNWNIGPQLGAWICHFRWEIDVLSASRHGSFQRGPNRVICMTWG